MKLKLVLYALVIGLCVVPVAGAQQTGALTPAQLVAMLQKGGLILYVRHAATDHSQSDKDLSDFSNCRLQRNLSDQGKREIAEMRDAIRALGIPIGSVYTSPYCRCVDTAKIGFGEYQILDEMRATFYTDKTDTAALSAFLKKQLSSKPRPGTNTVLVGHTANLRDVTSVWPKPEGVTHVFEPLGSNGYRHLGRIPPVEWKNIMDSK
ncbi:MAG: histidine phosphatase family protein [Rhodospirillales bacterium]|nr:histidine phosphatase family protein [Rhodospirillales bacterium]MBO6785408.1 histidine phosphatase family protein [Rhodospirillales bacterium]